jgi:hypothetical protein
MSRIVSIWLREWPISRLLLAQRKGSGSPADAPVDDGAIDPQRPLALVASGPGGARLAALNAAARDSGLAIGELLSNARSKVEGLQSRDLDPAADDAALRKCREIKESTARLACYDALPVTGTPRAAPGTPAPSRPASP